MDPTINVFLLHSVFILSCCSDQVVQSETGPEVRVQGVDEHGYLVVQQADGSTRPILPDRNSFDQTKNMIVPKLRQ